MNTLEQSFKNWEAHVFGYGYGTGEKYILPVLRQFMAICTPRDGSSSFSYDHGALELLLDPAPAWLLINVLCRADIIEYGTSPRFGWLTKNGEKLREFMLSKSDDELYALAANRSEDDPGCSPDVCNCGPMGYQKGVKCDNPFWNK